MKEEKTGAILRSNRKETQEEEDVIIMDTRRNGEQGQNPEATGKKQEGSGSSKGANGS